jgi:cob(I)alamin adenosyltransferase
VVRSEQYRRFAQECLVLLRNAEDERTRASLLHMARVWFRLAEERVNETDERRPAEG